MDAGFLSDKVILILSPQSWGNMMLAKHHYAIELAKRGNRVYFLNPPDNNHWSWKKSGERIRIHSSDQPNLFVIEQQLFFPYIFKFHARKLYNLLIKKQIRDLLTAIGSPIDLIWSFDLGNLFPLPYFDKHLFKVFHPVDEPRDHIALLAASGANILFSVTTEITGKYKHLNIPAYVIQHGLADEFLQSGSQSTEPDGRIKAGMSGNLLRPDLDRETLLRIIDENPEVEFHFYGSFTGKQSNIGSATGAEANAFIEALKDRRQVILHGVLSTDDLAKELNRMDLLLICYDIQKDQSKGTNYHKVMEYLSTGKVIVSNNITSFASRPDLVSMIEDRSSNSGLAELFRNTVCNLQAHNAGDLPDQRIRFARDNTYQRQLDRIEKQIQEAALKN